MKVLFVYRNNNYGFSIQRCFRPIEPLLVASGVELGTVSLPSKRAYPHNLIRDVIYLSLTLIKHRYDIIQVTGGCPHAMFVKPVCKLLGVRMVSTIHDLGFYSPDNTSLINKWHYHIGIKSLRFADHLVFVSRATKEEANRFYSIGYIPYSIIGDTVDPLIAYRKHSLNTDRPVILHVGTHFRKNIEGTIKALKGERIHLRIIGDLSETQHQCLLDNGTDYSQVSELTASEIINEYCNCDIVSFPTFYEGFGMPIIEAQATGRPVVTSNLSPMKDVAGEGAVLVDPNDVDSIKEGYKFAMANYDTIVESGLQNVKRFSVQVIANEYITLYKSIIKDK